MSDLNDLVWVQQRYIALMHERDAQARERDAAVAERDGWRDKYFGALTLRAGQEAVKAVTERDAAQSEAAALRRIVAGVHGALTDAATIPVPALDAPLDGAIRQLTAERDEATQALGLAEAMAGANRAEAAEVRAERDAALAAIEVWQREVSGRDADIDQLIRERDAAVALIRECRAWFNDGPDADRPDDLCARLDALLTPQASYPGRAPVLDPDGTGRDR